MAVLLYFIFLLNFLFFLGTNGLRIRMPCLLPNDFHCDDGACVKKLFWCDGGAPDCSDSSDERYCSISSPKGECNADIHFFCSSDDRCIPIEGHCDGYTSCPDGSDELDCPCDQLYEDHGSIAFEAFIGNFRTQNKCWVLVAKDGQDVNVSVKTRLHPRECHLGSIRLFQKKSSTCRMENVDNVKKICAMHVDEHFTFKGSVEIRYRSSFFSGENDPKDFFNITYLKVDPDCELADAFRCTSHSCILQEEQCDGKRDCENGLDEQNRDFTAFLKGSRRNATRWLESQRDADWGWRSNTPKAIVVLGLDGALGNTEEHTADLSAKQLELEVLTLLLRSENESISHAELSSYINALLMICHDPRNFYGFDLVQKLTDEVENKPGPALPLAFLTLCSAKGDIFHEDVDRLFRMVQRSKANGGFILEVEALALMALSCISRSPRYARLKQNITENLNALKKEQKEDGSFGSESITALVLQALTSNGQANDLDWNFKSSVEFLLRSQRADGSFGDFMTTYLVMPILSAKSLLDVGEANCTKRRRPREGNLMAAVKSRLDDEISVKFSLFIGDDKAQIHSIVLKMPDVPTMLDLMTLAADTDPKYRFKTHEIRKQIYVYEIFGIPNDPESNKFWFICSDRGNTLKPTTSQSLSRGRQVTSLNFIMWFKTLHDM